jgi:hypothetical protein
MVDIILAEHGGVAWLVRGERYIDDLLVNKLPVDVSIEIIACESESHINGLWRWHDGRPDPSRSPWMIHPGIVDRIRRTQSRHSVFFGQWSALLDNGAHAVIRAVALEAGESPGDDVRLISYIRPDESESMIDLTNIRCRLIEAELAALGISSSRFAREARDPATDPKVEVGTDRIDLQVGVPTQAES